MNNWRTSRVNDLLDRSALLGQFWAMQYGRRGKSSNYGIEESATYRHTSRPEATNPTLTARLSQDWASYEPDELRRTAKKCFCPIYALGPLSKKFKNTLTKFSQRSQHGRIDFIDVEERPAADG